MSIVGQPAFTIDTVARAVVCGGRARRVEPKVLACLELLWRHRNQLVTTAQLRAHVWPDSTVGEGSVAGVVRKARLAVQEAGLAIRSRKRLGYVLEAPSHVVDGEVLDEGAWPFVGRAAELAILRNVCRGEEGAPNAVLLSGEAGSGKSTLLSQALEAIPAGTWCFRGRCLAGWGVPPFWAWGELIRGLAEDVKFGARLVELAAELPEARSILAAVPGVQVDVSGLQPLGAAPYERQVTASRALAGVLSRLLSPQGAVIVLDDMHWADDASLRLAEEVAAVAGQGIHMVVSARTEPDRHGGPFDAFERRLLERGATHLSLAPLDASEVHEVLARRRFPWASEADARALRDSTGGNPLFVRQWLEHLNGGGSEPHEQSPHAWTHVISARLAALPSASQRLLQYAAVLGEEFPESMLEPLAEPAVLEEALRTGLLERASSHGRYRFHHALVRDAICGSLTHEVRQVHHGAAFRAWCRAPAGSERTAALAAHGAEGRGQVPPEVVQRHAERAGLDAFEAQDFPRAARHLATALELADVLGFETPARARLALWLARARWHADEPQDSVGPAYARALELARHPGCADLFAQAAIGGAIGEDSPLEVADARSRASWAVHLDEAFHRLSRSRHASLRQRVAAALCWMRGAYADWEGARLAARHVLERDPAQQTGSSQIQALGIDCVAELWEGRVAAASPKLHKLLATCGELDLPISQRIEGYIQALTLALQLGDLSVYREGIACLKPLSEQVPDPFRSGRLGWRQAVYKMAPRWLSMGLAVIEGDLPEAGRLLASMAELTRRQGIAQQGDGSVAALMLLPLFAYQGRCQVLEPLFQGGSLLPDELGARAAELRFALERRDAAGIRGHLDRLRERGFRVDYAGVACPARPYDLACMADACAFVGDTRSAELLYGLLWPWREQFASDAVSLGSVWRPLGTLARCLGDGEAAERHLRQAAAANRRFGHRPERVRSELDLAALLCERGRGHEADRWAASARQEASTMGLRGPVLAGL